MKQTEDLVYDYRTGRFVPRVPGVVKMDRALIYIRKQLENHIETINNRKTKTLGDSLYDLYDLSNEVGQIGKMSDDGFLQGVMNEVLDQFNERTPRQNALASLRYLLGELEDYQPILETDDMTTKKPAHDAPAEKTSQPDTAEKSSVFVIMPFKPEFNDVWKGGIQRAADDEGFKPIRVDMINRSTNITDDIVGSIDKCHVAIVDVTGNNPNVMFELGYAMARQKPNIIISQSADYLPFDIRNIRTIVYANTWTGIEELKTKVQTFLKEYKSKKSGSSKNGRGVAKRRKDKKKGVKRKR
jgi:hypothetical protein